MHQRQRYEFKHQNSYGPDGALHIEGLDQIAGQDVTVTVSWPTTSVGSSEFDLEQYASPTIGPEVAASIMAIGAACSSLPVLDDRSADEILADNVYRPT
ncbi:hypothetical protein [Synechococcus sp. PCC 7335]|uniref:hypothetical protein n=1 Tax=Synechococcus sp. (strain ATCC 29403 / PCC 7335) TaxID=91464 RepID=UPI0002D40755|nr:hypothetical protein [Synechococcus sp. PCC 7335]